MIDKNYFTFKTKEEVLELNKEDVENNGYEIKTVKIDDVYVSYSPHFGCTPDLHIEANSNWFLYSGWNCIKSIGYQIQELFELLGERYHYKWNDDGEDLDWFQEKEIDVIMVQDNQGYLKPLAIGDANKDKWINLGSWISDIFNKHTK